MTVQRIGLVPYTRDWSYDLTAIALQQHLSDRFEIRIFHRETLDKLKSSELDLIVDFWWKGSLHRRFPGRVAKQVSSHRWAKPRHGRYDAAGLAIAHLRRNVAVFVPSKRLEAELAPVSKRPIALCPKGFHAETFGDAGDRRGELAVGWAGNEAAEDKNLQLIVSAWTPLISNPVRVAGGSLTQAQMPAFYNSVDIITCASDAEGDPRPLIEGMACGCFPITVDVGIVPELVRHGDNGLIVERSVGAFAEAFAWCRDNLEHVREAGRRNAQQMLASRTWAQVSRQWGAAFDLALASRR